MSNSTYILPLLICHQLKSSKVESGVLLTIFPTTNISDAFIMTVKRLVPDGGVQKDAVLPIMLTEYNIHTNYEWDMRPTTVDTPWEVTTFSPPTPNPSSSPSLLRHLECTLPSEPSEFLQPRPHPRHHPHSYCPPPLLQKFANLLLRPILLAFLLSDPHTR